MLYYLIKNNIKLMFRNKWVIVLLIMGPVFVIAMLSSAFEELMKSYEKADSFLAGYRMEEESAFAGGIDWIKEAGKEAGIVFSEYPEGEPEELMSSNGLAGFVVFEKDKYSLYESDDNKAEGIALEYFISRVMDQTGEGIPQGFADTAKEERFRELPVEKLDYMPAIDSTDYYGIVYIVYFIWCGIVCISGALSSEKKNGIFKKYQVSAVSVQRLFLSRWISCTAVVAGGIAVTVLLCAWMFGITWGNIPWSILILFFGILAANAFGLFVFYLVDNLAITIGLVFTAVFFMGFVGGSFETYMFSSIPEWIKQLSPIYWLDRTLVEYSCMGKSDCTGVCIGCMLGIIVICTSGAMLADKIKRRGKA